MNAREFLDLQDAYQGVYQEFDEATAMAKRGLNEPEIRQQIAKSTGGGAAADRATALADKKTFGQRGIDPKARQDLARKQRGDFRKTTSSSPGLHGYGHKSDDPAVKAKQDARGKQRGVLTPKEKEQLNMEMGYDTFDSILEHLVAEGYADTNESAIAIMANMSEEWREEILDEAKKKFPEDKVDTKSAKHERDYLKRPNSQVGQRSLSNARKMKAIASTVSAGDDPRNTMHGQDLRKIK